MAASRLRATACAVLLMGGCVIDAAAAQSYPSQPVKIVVPFAPGGPPDVSARLVGEWLSSRLGPIVIENRPGAGGTIASKFVAGAAPDGHTLLLGTAGSLAVSPAIYTSPGYDPIKDFTPISGVSTSRLVMAVAASVPAQTVRELVAYARANPGRLNFGAVTGTPPHLAGLMFGILTNTNIVFVPYKGASQATTDVIAGQIQMTIEGISGIMPFIQIGKLRPLAITGPQRVPQLPQLPTIIESGFPDLPAASWTGVLAPAGTPAGIVAKLNAVINDGLASADMRERFGKLGAETIAGSPGEFGLFLASEVQRWAEIAKLTGVVIH